MTDESIYCRDQSEESGLTAAYVNDANVSISNPSTEASNTSNDDIASANELLALLIDTTRATSPIETETYEELFMCLKAFVVSIPDSPGYQSLLSRETFGISHERLRLLAYIYRMANDRVAYKEDDDQQDQAEADKELLSQWWDHHKAYDDMLLDVEKRFNDGRIEIITSLWAETQFTDEKFRVHIKKLNELWDQFQEGLKNGTRKLRASLKLNEGDTLSGEAGDQEHTVDIEDGPLGRFDIRQIIRALRAEC